ncbi:MAG: sigma-54 interaction domain-containing protein [Leptothrix ochracea]|uniref:sigma-54 interaction domain-containing protein n=2 Tax=Leptothrix ochracea TaxID=735331 RepID=UPI0034E1CC6E
MPGVKLLPELVSYLEGLAEPHILFDRQYRILAANAAYRKQFSPEGSVVGRTCYEVSHHFSVPCDQAGECCPLAKARSSGQRERVLHLHHTPKGEAYVNIELLPLRNAEGEMAYFVEKMEAVRTVSSATAAAAGWELVGRAPAFQRMLQKVARVAPSEATVLLQGESGTGKELVARAVHAASRRAHKPLVVLDCTSLPEHLFESELFGHERGSFTGATHQKQGLVESASGGTLFLDEVGEIPLPMQVKLLRLLESGTYRRVGSTEWRHADIRVISATHRDLRDMASQNLFRSDLYFRLSTFPIHLPPLRERREDLALLVPALLARLRRDGPVTLAPATLELLSAYDFPGNVRELRNLLERASLLCDGPVLEPHHVEEALTPEFSRAAREAVSPPPASPSTVPPAEAAVPPRSLHDLSRDLLRAEVLAHRGSRAELAQRLGVSERTLYRRLKALDTIP